MITFLCQTIFDRVDRVSYPSRNDLEGCSQADLKVILKKKNCAIDILM